MKVSNGPLDKEEQGISIFSKGVWHAISLAGSEGKEMSQYIFGEIDVPKLEDDTSLVAPFNVSRSMELNPNNELVQETYAFIHSKVEEVRRRFPMPTSAAGQPKKLAGWPHRQRKSHG